MQIHSSTLPKVPEAVDVQDSFLSLEFCSGPKNESAHLQIESALDMETLLSIAQFWLPFRKSWNERMQAHSAYFRMDVPRPRVETGNARLQIAVPFIDSESDEIESAAGAEHCADFDNLMENVQDALREMVRVGMLIRYSCGLDIVCEPLTLAGKTNLQEIERVSTIISDTWLELRDKAVFRCFRYWNPQKGAWEDISAPE